MLSSSVILIIMRALSLTGLASEGKSLRLVSGFRAWQNSTVDAEVALILMHELDDFVAGDVFGKSLDVGWIRTRAPGWSARSVLREQGWAIPERRQ